MDDAIRQVDALTVHEIQRELRKRSLAVTGIKSDIRKRLIEALRTDYNDGWTCGRLLSMRLIPFNGDGIDPQTLVGLHITGIDQARSHGNVKLSFSDGDSVFICSRPTTTAADPVKIYRDFKAQLSDWPRAEIPMRILEATMAEWRNERGKVSSTFLVLRLKGIGTRLYFGRRQDKRRSDTYLPGIYLAAQERHPDLEREELLIAVSG